MASPAVTLFLFWNKWGMDKAEKVKNHIQEIKKKLEQQPENPLRPPKKSEEKLVAIEFQKEYDFFKSFKKERVQSLLRFRFKGRPVLILEKAR